MSSQKQRRARLSLIDRALIEQAWHSNAVRAQIHAIVVALDPFPVFSSTTVASG